MLAAKYSDKSRANQPAGGLLPLGADQAVKICYEFPATLPSFPEALYAPRPSFLR